MLFFLKFQVMNHTTLEENFLMGKEKKQDCGGLQKEDFIAGENCSTAERAYRDTEENNNCYGSHSYEIP